MTRILVTGSRDWQNRTLIRTVLAEYTTPEAVLVVGDCPTGADDVARHVWGLWPGGHVEIHCAGWSVHGRAAGPIRNQAMVDSAADVCLAFIRDGSKGATDCVARCRTAGIPVRVWTESRTHYPDDKYAPHPSPLCRTERIGDDMSGLWGEVTCLDCRAVGVDHVDRPVTHYADEGLGVSFDAVTMTAGPVDPLCGRGRFGDLMTWFIEEVTCPSCRADAAPRPHRTPHRNSRYG